MRPLRRGNHGGGVPAPITPSFSTTSHENLVQRGAPDTPQAPSREMSHIAPAGGGLTTLNSHTALKPPEGTAGHVWTILHLYSRWIAINFYPRQHSVLEGSRAPSALTLHSRTQRTIHYHVPHCCATAPEATLTSHEQLPHTVLITTGHAASAPRSTHSILDLS